MEQYPYDSVAFKKCDLIENINEFWSSVFWMLSCGELN